MESITYIQGTLFYNIIQTTIKHLTVTNIIGLLEWYWSKKAANLKGLYQKGRTKKAANLKGLKPKKLIIIFNSLSWFIFMKLYRTD